MDKKTMDIVLGNTAIKIAGKANDDSLKVMAKEMENLVNTKDFSKLKKYEFFVHNSFVDGEPLVMKLKTPDFLVKMEDSPFYMTKEQLKETILHLVNKSGYYVATGGGDTKQQVGKENEGNRKKLDGSKPNFKPKFRKNNDR